MSIQKSINLALAGFIALLSAAIMLVTISVSAQDAEVEATPVTTQEEESETPAEEETAEETATEEGSYDYVAQSGDSYSLMARKAIQTYGVNNSVNLSGAQIIFVETNLTIAAGSPTLNLGDNVSIDGSLVSEWVEKAQALTEQQQAAWQPYADNANFNTDAVGQPQE
jgi:hypothetical protein